MVTFFQLLKNEYFLMHQRTESTLFQTLLRSCETNITMGVFDDIVRHPISLDLRAEEKRSRGLGPNIAIQMIKVSKYTIKNMVSLCRQTFLLLFCVWIEKQGIF